MNKETQISSELDLQDWAIITATDIIITHQTYNECVILREQEKLNPDEATIVTNACAHRMLRNKLLKGETNAN